MGATLSPRNSRVFAIAGSPPGLSRSRRGCRPRLRGAFKRDHDLCARFADAGEQMARRCKFELGIILGKESGKLRAPPHSQQEYLVDPPPKCQISRVGPDQDVALDFSARRRRRDGLPKEPDIPEVRVASAKCAPGLGKLLPGPACIFIYSLSLSLSLSVTPPTDWAVPLGELPVAHAITPHKAQTCRVPTYKK